MFSPQQSYPSLPTKTHTHFPLFIPAVVLCAENVPWEQICFWKIAEQVCYSLRLAFTWTRPRLDPQSLREITRMENISLMLAKIFKCRINFYLVLDEVKKLSKTLPVSVSLSRSIHRLLIVNNVTACTPWQLWRNGARGCGKGCTMHSASQTLFLSWHVFHSLTAGAVYMRGQAVL